MQTFQISKCMPKLSACVDSYIVSKTVFVALIHWIVSYLIMYWYITQA